MPSFPTRLTRNALGPTFRDAYAPENPETDVGAAQFNAAFHALAGMSLVVPRAVLIGKWNGSALDKYHEAQAWNPNGSQSPPTFARVGDGNYTYTFAANYLDEVGNSVATVLRGARCFSIAALGAYADRIEPRAWIDPGDPLVVQVRLWVASGGGAGSGTDAGAFWLDVF